MKPVELSAKLAEIAERINHSVNPSRKLVADDIQALVMKLNDIPTGSKPIPDLKEGNFSVPALELVDHLQKWLNAKYVIDLSYRNFADRLKGPWRDSIVDHWYKHSEQERQHAYDLTMKIVALGHDPVQTNIVIPEVPAEIDKIFCNLMEQELAAIEAGRVTVKMSGENTALKIMAENFVLIDSEHLDDLRRMHP
jgi:bacterioferritin (cytochrome b1)